MIAVCFITKNEEKNLGFCMDHLKPLIQEFIVVDTGSTDRTVEMAQERGAKVFSIPWPGNFSEARNRSLEMCTQKWILKIDPDERLDPQDFLAIQELTKTETVAYQFFTRAYTNDVEAVSNHSFQLCVGEYSEMEKGYRGYLTYPSIRLFQKLPGVHYVGYIHETVESTLPGWNNGKSPVPLPLSSPPFHHYGHNQQAIQEKGKNELYSHLIQEELKRNSKNWYVYFEAGIKAFSKNDFQEAVEMFEKANQALPHKPQVLSNWGYALIRAGRKGEGEAALKQCLEVDPHYHDAWLNLGVSRMEVQDYKKALTYFNQCLEISHRSVTALRAKGHCLSFLEQFQEAEECFRKALSFVPFFVEAKVDLAILLSHVQRKPESRKILEEVLAEHPHHKRANQLYKGSEGL